MPYLVRDRLFLGGIRDALEVLQRGSNEITHVLSLLSSVSLDDLRPPVSVRTEEIRTVYMDGDDGARRVRYTVERAGTELEQVRMAVAMADEENEDLLGNLELCLDFIDDGRKEGAVLVHCFAGISRSASVMTAYLMRSERLSLEDALESLRQSCEVVCPNDGFLDQLKMFEEMGFRVDRTSRVYKRWAACRLGKERSAFFRMDRLGLGLFRAPHRRHLEVLGGVCVCLCFLVWRFSS